MKTFMTRVSAGEDMEVDVAVGYSLAPDSTRDKPSVVIESVSNKDGGEVFVNSREMDGLKEEVEEYEFRRQFEEWRGDSDGTVGVD